MKRRFILLAVLLIALCVFSACESSDEETIDWGNLYLGKLLPAPSSNKMEVSCNDEELLDVYVNKISMNGFLEYTNQCEANGFNVEADRSGNSGFEAFNSEGYKLHLIYDEDEANLNIMLSAPKKLGDLDWPANIENILPAPASKVGKFSWNDESGLYVYVGETSPDAFKEYTAACREAGFTIDAYEDDDYFSADNSSGCELVIYYMGFNTIEISLSYPENFKAPTEPIIAPPQEETETDATVDETVKITVQQDADAFKGMHYEEAADLFKSWGFTNIVCEPSSYNYDDKPAFTVSYVSLEWFLFSESEFKAGDAFDSDYKVRITYYEAEEPEETIVTLTVDSCPDLATLVSIKDPCDPFVKTFASQYSDQYIEFDGAIYAMQYHGNYSTRFDILMNPCDFDENSCSGPNFRFTDVNTYDLDISTLFLEDILWVGRNIHVIAKVGNYNADTSLFELDPVSVTARD